MIVSSQDSVCLSGVTNEASSHTARAKSGRRFLATASISAMAMMLSHTAQTQLPTGCTPNMPVAEDTVTCLGTITETIATTVDDLTIVVGDGTMPTTVTTTVGDGINVNATGGQSITVAAGSSVVGASDGINVNNGSGALTLNLAGDVTGLNGDGIYAFNGGEGNYAFNGGGGNTLVTTADVTVTGNYGTAIDVENNYYAVDLTVNTAAGTISGYSGIYAENDGTGNTLVTTADVTATGNYGLALRVENDDYAGDLLSLIHI